MSTATWLVFASNKYKMLQFYYQLKTVYIFVSALIAV